MSDFDWIQDGINSIVAQSGNRVHADEMQKQYDAIKAQVTDYDGQLNQAADELAGVRVALEKQREAIACYDARVVALEAERDKYRKLWEAVIAHKADVSQCLRCGWAEDWWTDSNADYATREILGTADTEGQS